MTMADARRAHRGLRGVPASCRWPHVGARAACTTWLVVVLIGLTTAARQGCWACLLTPLSDSPACHAGATVAGLGGMAIALFIGFVLQAIGSDIPIFFCGGCGLLPGAGAGAGGGAPPGATGQPARVEQPA
ncbi:hypothetical protein FMO13_12420 [Xanthomonas phaseoli pv. dieffenbachiae]